MGLSSRPPSALGLGRNFSRVAVAAVSVPRHRTDGAVRHAQCTHRHWRADRCAVHLAALRSWLRDHRRSWLAAAAVVRTVRRTGPLLLGVVPAGTPAWLVEGGGPPPRVDCRMRAVLHARARAVRQRPSLVL